MPKTMRILKQTVKNTAGFKTSLLFTIVAFFYLHFTFGRDCQIAIANSAPRHTIA